MFVDMSRSIVEVRGHQRAKGANPRALWKWCMQPFEHSEVIVA